MYCHPLYVYSCIYYPDINGPRATSVTTTAAAVGSWNQEERFPGTAVALCPLLGKEDYGINPSIYFIIFQDRIDNI